MKERFKLIVADPPWGFGDKLTMSSVKRGAASQYSTLTVDQLCALGPLYLKDCTSFSSILGLWVPASLLEDGLKVMDAWGFTLKQVWPWVKTSIKTVIPEDDGELPFQKGRSGLTPGRLGFGMGRLGRSCSEIALVGTRGKVYQDVAVRNIRSIVWGPIRAHSAKPDMFQEKLQRIYPLGPRLELFGRRPLEGWTVVGNEGPDSMGEDIRDTLNRMRKEVL
jgi:N6-adenosine-specific RNA methylase IME4